MYCEQVISHEHRRTRKRRGREGVGGSGEGKGEEVGGDYDGQECNYYFHSNIILICIKYVSTVEQRGGETSTSIIIIHL